METRILLITLLLIGATAVNGQRTLPPNIGGSCLLDIALVIDCSGSITKNDPANNMHNWDFIIDFIVDMITSINVGEDRTHIGAVSFGNEAYLQFYLSNFTDTQSLENAVRVIPYCNQNTNTTGGLRVARTQIFNSTNGDRSDIPNTLILITDGNPSPEYEADMLDEEAQRIKEDRGIRIVGLGVTDQVNETLIRSIVTDYDNDYIFVTDFDVLEKGLDDLINRACRTETTTTSTPVSLTPTFRPPHIGGECHVDIALVVDCSGSIRDTNAVGEDNWQLIIDFMVDLVSSINIGEEKTHVGAVSFGNEAYLQFYLSNFTDSKSLQSAVRNIPYCGGNTHTTGGLRRTRTEIFNTAHGDRPEVPNVIVLITDGIPTLEVEFLEAEARLIKSFGMRIVGVGVTDKVNETVIRSLVSNEKTDYIFATEYHDLGRHLHRLINQTCYGGFFSLTLPPRMSTPGVCMCPCPTDASSVTAGLSSLLLLLLLLIVAFIQSDLRQ